MGLTCNQEDVFLETGLGKDKKVVHFLSFNVDEVGNRETVFDKLLEFNLFLITPMPSSYLGIFDFSLLVFPNHFFSLGSIKH